MRDVDVLRQAHAHVRKGAEELQHIHFNEAAEENQLASADFARAAKGTSDSEVREISLIRASGDRV